MQTHSLVKFIYHIGIYFYYQIGYSIFMKQVRSEFLQMIKARMKEENLGIRELARRIGVSHPTVTDIVTYGNMPSFDTCNKLSKWLNISEETGLRKAGLLPLKPDTDDWVEEMNDKITRITDPTRREMAKKLLNTLVEDEQAGRDQQQGKSRTRSTGK
jgi:transcriptional regulator with XRE-family HTH domain